MTTRIASGSGPRCLVTWPMLAAPGLSHLYGAKVVFDGLSWQIGQAKVVSTDVDPPYGYCAMASDGQGNYLLAWHDIRNRAVKKTQPWQVAWPDLARAAVKAIPGQSLDFTLAGSTLMFQANSSDYYPDVAFDGKNYLVMWGGCTSDLVHFNAQLGCLVAIKFGGYVTPDSKLLEAFYIKPSDGGHADLGDVCFGATEGLVVYRYTVPHEYPRLRAQFVAKSP